MTSGISVKSSGLVNTCKYINKTYGDDVMEDIFSRMPEESSKALRNVMATTMTPIEYTGELVNAIKEVLGKEGADINFKIANESAKGAFSMIYKIYFKLGDPQVIIKKAANAWSSLISKGRLEIIEQGNKHLKARLIDFSYDNTEYCGQRLRGWMQAPLELSGCRITENIHTACRSKGDPYCEWKIAWE